MIKRYTKSKTPLMRRSVRIYLNDLNHLKQNKLLDFLQRSRDITQYYLDLFWQRQDFTPVLADLNTVHLGKYRFNTTSRICQALAKQAKETIRSQIEKGKKTKPQCRRHTVTLCSNFIELQTYNKTHFDIAIVFKGSGAPKLLLPIHSTTPLNKRLQQGWNLSKTIRLGRDNNRLWVDLLVEKERPVKKTEGSIVGMDSNYKAGFVFSDGQQVGQRIYTRIQEFEKRQKHTHKEIDNELGKCLKEVDWSDVKVLAIEDLKGVKNCGTFSRKMNRRMSHWLYRACITRIERVCEEQGIRLEKKDPWKTSQTCNACYKWDKRNRKGDKFLCVHCGNLDNADSNASKNLEYLAVVGKYSFHLPKKPKVCFSIL